ncbi:MAG: Uma2 family endonuclease [Okeania sp. SIO3I5]|uniref:Uma2 family endonuclease n=1 Tax=Okeania sp. SIO3I5 TaxID=2607805 RepID=UPI0013B5B053|nr:Uma2 family endonuclease [Okeania sp. SIO3I5]NEQ36367.1 Uma2 family endonuclease [Okeania sp. SIO3I5]
MIETKLKFYTFAEYLEYQDGTDNKYELVNGELISLIPASGIHALILTFLFKEFYREIIRINAPWQVMPGNVGVRTTINKSRIPDLTIITAEQTELLKNMTTAILDSAPILVVEIVSPGNRDDDYRFKLSEYAVTEIPEYWIVDFEAQKISVLSLVNGFYEVEEFKNEDLIISGTFSELKLTVNQILSV